MVILDEILVFMQSEKKKHACMHNWEKKKKKIRASAAAPESVIAADIYFYVFFHISCWHWAHQIGLCFGRGMLKNVFIVPDLSIQKAWLEKSALIYIDVNSKRFWQCVEGIRWNCTTDIGEDICRYLWKVILLAHIQYRMTILVWGLSLLSLDAPVA